MGAGSIGAQWIGSVCGWRGSSDSVAGVGVLAGVGWLFSLAAAEGTPSEASVPVPVLALPFIFPTALALPLSRSEVLQPQDLTRQALTHFQQLKNGGR